VARVEVRVGARVEARGRSEGAERGSRGEGRVGARGGAFYPTEQGSHRGVARYAIAVELHLDQRPLLAPVQICRY
jgi:hypothetical protein